MIPRLIEREELHLEASVAGLRERYTSGETQQTIHVWWARRPHSAMRALVMFSLLRENSGVSLADAFNPTKIDRVRAQLFAAYGRKPKVLDPFGGGGTIPFEASYLGAESYSMDTNAMAALIQNANLVYSAALRESGTMDLLRATGDRALSMLSESSAMLFPQRINNVMTYIWSYQVECAECSRTFSISKRPWLSKKKGRTTFHSTKADAPIVCDVGEPPASNWNGRNGSVCCPHCNAMRQATLKSTSDLMCAAVYSNGRPGKCFRPAQRADMPSETLLRKTEHGVLKRLQKRLPETQIPKWSGIINPSVYGMETHSDHLNRRQRCVMLLLIEALTTLHASNVKSHGFEIARFVTCALAGLIDQLVDWNSRLSMWIPQNEQVGRGLCGPGVAMLWDYAETDPVGKGPSNLHAKLDRIMRGVEALAGLPSAVNVKLGSAMELPYPEETFDAVITDPPYYDNVFYAPLADFIYPWKRLLLEDITPEFFKCDLTDGVNELVSSTIRAGSSEKAHARYCTMFNQALSEAARVLKKDGIFSLVYSHASVNGWSALVEAFQRSKFTVQSAQPLAIERKARPRAMTSEAVNTCIVFVSHLNGRKKKVTHDKAVELFKARLSLEFLNELRSLGWNESDAGIALFARLLTPLCNMAFSNLDIGALVIEAGALVSTVCPGFQLVNRRSL